MRTRVPAPGYRRLEPNRQACLVCDTIIQANALARGSHERSKKHWAAVEAREARRKRELEAIVERARQRRASQARARCRPLTDDEIRDLRAASGLRPPRKGRP